MAGFSAFPPQWKRRRGTIAASDTIAVLTRPLSTLRSLKLVASFFSVSEDKTKQIELGIIYSDGSLKDSLQKIGSKPSIAINSVIDGSDLKVEVTNNETYEIKFNLIFADFKANF